MKAASFAAQRHRHQMRKDGETPYIAHPFRVTMIVRDLFNIDDEEVLAAALLHDTIEDTCTDYDDLAANFGERVAGIVSVLTKDMSKPETLREKEYDLQLAAGPWEARLIKLADVLDNSVDAGSIGISRKAADKVARALALAEGDDRLVDAVNKVRIRCDWMLERERV